MASAQERDGSREPVPFGDDVRGLGPEDEASNLNRRHVRGSMLLLAGRLLSLVFTVLTQIVIVRALSKADFGVFAYAFALQASGRVLLSLGQGRLLSRFMTTYEEKQDYGRMFGSMILAAGTIVVTSALLVASLLVFRGPLLGSLLDDRRAVDVLLILVFLAPLEALDQVFVSLFAVFSEPTAIFYRKYVVTPALRLGVVVVIAATHGSVYLLALGYVLTSVLGNLIYLVLLRTVLRERGIARRLRGTKITLPFREVFSFSLPTMTSELVFLATNLGSVVILGAYWGARQVADFRAVAPAARFNQVIYQTFVTMFLPMTARLHARDDHDGVRETYWHTSHVLAISTFPVFAMTTVFARTTTVTLFGERYATAAPVLLALSIGFYVSVALGFNTYVLQVYGRLRFLVLSNVGVALACLGLTFALTPSYGATGAAVANGSTLALQNVVNQLVLMRTLHRGREPMKYLMPYLVLGGATGVLVLVQILVDPGFVVALVVCGLVGLGVLRLTRHSLALVSMFPELRKVPALSPFIA
jgi:O-antigen/teichoic acid export membrane protein